MLNKHLKIIIAFVVFLVIWLVFSWVLSDEPSSTNKDDTNSELLGTSIDPLKSVVQPVESAILPQVEALENHSQSSKYNTRVDNDNSGLSRKFTQANQLAQQGNKQEAIAAYRSLIKDYPESLESYLNLAVIYVEQQNLEQARLTLSAGLNAREDSAALYKSLQQVHNALAGQAYQRALNKTQAQTPILALQKATRLSEQISSPADKKYEQRIASQASQHQREIGAYQEKIRDFETQLETLQKELNSAALLASSAQDQQQAAREQLEKQKNAQQLAQQLAEQQKTEQAAAREQQAILAKQKEQREKAQAQKIQTEDAAVSLVNAWAKAWSAQDVKSYVSFYTDDYVPAGKNLTHKQWLAQRQIRLTNKSFINVEVSDYKVKDLGGRFSVTFTQHYRSDSIDDRIRKRLTFAKSGDNWSKAKIMNERVL